MKRKNMRSTEEVIRRTLIGLLEDFQEHAGVVLRAQQDVKFAEAGSDRFDGAVAKLDAACTALVVTVPAILRELDQLDEIPADVDSLSPRGSGTG
jgi:hypothetical protein